MTMTTNATSAMLALGFMNNTGGQTIGGGDTLNSSGLYGYCQLNKAGSPHTTATLLSGAAGTDSITTNFAAGNTITVNAVTISFVASGAVGNTQINITDSIGTLLGKIDLATGTSTPSIVRAPVLDATYAGNNNKVDLMLKEFYSSAQAGQVISRYKQEFAKLSMSSGMAISGVPGGIAGSGVVQGYFSFGFKALTNVQADMTQPANSLWEIMRLANAGKRRMVVST
jgi:hypothetical protein